MTVTQGDQFKEGSADQKVVYVLQQSESAQNDDEADLGQLIRVIWRRRWWIAGLTATITAAGVAYALLVVPIYRAEAVLLPRENNAGFGLSAQLSQFAGLAELAGVSVGSAGKQEPLGVLRSKGFARRFIAENKLVDTLAAESHSRATGDDSAVGKSPDIRRVVDDFTRSVMSVTEDKKSGLVTVAVEWKDPDTAALWANGMVRQLNDEMRMRALHEAESNIHYLSGQLEKTGLVAMQQSISRVLESEMQKVMLARGTSEYAFRIIDAAEPPARRERPKRGLIVALTFALGLGLSAFLAVIADPLKRIVTAARATSGAAGDGED